MILPLLILHSMASIEYELDKMLVAADFAPLKPTFRTPNWHTRSWGCGMWARMRSFNGDSRRSLLTKQIVGAIEQQGAWQLSNGTKEGKIIFNSSVNWGCGIVVLPSLTVRQRSRVGEVPAVGSVSYRLTT